MTAIAYDHLVLAVPDLEAAAEPFERLGLWLTPPARRVETATVSRVFFVRDGARETSVQLVAVADATAATASPFGAAVLETLRDGRTTCAVGLSVDDLSPVRAELGARAIAFVESAMHEPGGSPIATLLEPNDDRLFGCPVVIACYTEPAAARLQRHAAGGWFDHEFALKRFDHAAMIVPDDGPERAWADVLAAPVTRAVDGAGWVARQIQMDGGTVEFIRSTSPDGPMARRRLGLSRLAAFEVEDLDATVAFIRSKGFTLPDPGRGFAGESRNATLALPELAGFRLLLVERHD